MSNSLQGRTVVVFGVANKRSIAWAIAQQMQQAGAQLAMTYQNQRLKEEADDLIAALPNAQAFQCDVSRDEEIAQLFEQLKSCYGKLDALVHSVAFAPAEELKGEFVDTSREGFRIAMDISVYSLVALARAARPLMTDGGSIMTMTYYGAEKVVPRYNVMGVAKAALKPAFVILPTISARTKSASTPFLPVPSRRWLRAVFPASATCCRPRRRARRCNAMWR